MKKPPSNKPGRSKRPASSKQLSRALFAISLRDKRIAELQHDLEHANERAYSFAGKIVDSVNVVATLHAKIRQLEENAETAHICADVIAANAEVLPQDQRWKLKQALAGSARYYGSPGTIHTNNSLDIGVKDGRVLAVWFRCQLLRFEQYDVGPEDAAAQGSLLTGVEVLDD